MLLSFSRTPLMPYAQVRDVVGHFFTDLTEILEVCELRHSEPLPFLGPQR